VVSCHKLQVFYLDVSRVSHTCCKCMCSKRVAISKYMLHSNVFNVVSILCCSVGGQRTRHAARPRAGGWGCCGRGALGSCSSSATDPGSLVPLVQREEGVMGKDRWA
jgi:hypothetical protein